MSLHIILFACGLAFLHALSARAQEKPFRREFPADTISGYRILLTVRTEVEGQQPVAPVERLPGRPKFRGRPSVETQIEGSDEKPCPAFDSGRSAVRRQP